MRKLGILLTFLPMMLLAQEANMNTKVERYLQEHLSELNLYQNDIVDYSISRQYNSKKTGLTHVFLQQNYFGIPVHKAEIRLHWHNEKGWIRTQNSFVNDIENVEKQTQTVISEVRAIEYACAALEITYTKPSRLSKRNETTSLFDADFSIDAIPVMEAYFESEGVLRKVWDLTIYEKDASDCWNVLIDANTGELLRKYNWVQHCTFSSKEATCSHTNHESVESVEEFSLEQSSGATYNVFAIPLESPSHGSRTLEVDPNNSVASPYGWHDTNGSEGAEYTITRGNNVHAYADLNDWNSSQGDEPDGGDDLHFDFPFDPMTEPDQNLDAATVNLFYMNNMMHDVWYHYGFDPQSGNFQQHNYGEGGSGGDYVFAQAQDSSGVGTNYALNNANFYTPGDGSNPVMQMYLWDKPENPYDLFTVNSPSDIAGVYEVSPSSDWSGQITSTPITGDLQLADDGSTWGVEGCDEFTSDFTGKIALISRGTCEFGLKALNAQNAGAIAVIIYNNVGGMVNMSAGADGADVTIPAVFMSKLDGELLRDKILSEGIVNATFVNNSPPGPEYLDGDFDNGIIAHEYGHGISTRLAGINCLSGDEQAGEGWSDFFALMMTTDINDNGEEPHGIGTYVSAEQNDGRGIRSYPYSRDMSVNPMTYDYIITESVPHGVGSVWTTILWDLHWNFVDVYGYDEDLYTGTGGNNKVMQLVIDGLKIQACGATFIELRDAIIVADELLYEGENACLIWETFARRGLGYSASGGTSDSRSDGTQAFDNLPECVKELKIKKTAQANAKAGDQIEYSLTVQNHTDDLISAVSILDTLQNGVSYVASSSTCDVQANGNVLTFSLGDLASGAEQTCVFAVQTDNNLYSAVLFEDDMEDGDDYWLSFSEEDVFWELDDVMGAHSGDEAWFIPNLEDRFESYLDLQPFMVEGDAPTLSFWHKYITEAGYDGGYISISTDEVNFEDLGAHIIRGHYRGESQGPPPLGGKDSFWGNSNGFVNTIVDLSSYAGETVTIRFTFVTDEGNSENAQVEGWTIDDVRIIDRYQVENRACVTSGNNQNYACDEIEDGGTMIFDHYGVEIEEVASSLFVQIFPNPSNEQVSVRLSGDWQSTIQYALYDVQGKLVDQNKLTTRDFIIPTQDYANGMYLIEISDGNTEMIKKLSIQH